MKRGLLFLYLAIVVTGIVSGVRQTYADAVPPPENISSEIIKLSDDLYQVGNVKIYKNKRFISIPGSINMSDGLIEYLACGPRGKLHESVLVLDVEPYHIHVALLLLGLVPGDRPISSQGAPEPPCGDPVKIKISWKGTDNKIVEYAPEDLIINMDDKKNMEKSDWVFTGSRIINGHYMAQILGSIVAVFHDPDAIIDDRSISGADDTHFFANKEILPPFGTPVELKIFGENDPAVKKRVSCENAGR
ncbi:MAG: YdjY domain-containing protein [Desulfobacula sp.]|jgi:hypothetical protein